ncbi:hypothetical protein [Thiocapsa marina]|uniref:hypothetical protein n=1 Tax=Thiocapsa marina TaxID=244573 RepID=UPI000307BDC7|nr:hypothetical protein [Thiocapsa marina]
MIGSTPAVASSKALGRPTCSRRSTTRTPGAWLAGFAGAWAEGGSDEAAEDDLVAALAGRPALLRQLWERGPGKIARSRS